MLTRGWMAAALLVGGILAAEGWAGEAPGSWQGSAPALQVARRDRTACSSAFLPPPLARGRQLTSLGWQFSAPRGAPLQAWLCHPQHCVMLPVSRGQTRALVGLDAGKPLQLCFRLGAESSAVRVGGLQLQVDYR